MLGTFWLACLVTDSPAAIRKGFHVRSSLTRVLGAWTFSLGEKKLPFSRPSTSTPDEEHQSSDRKWKASGTSDVGPGNDPAYSGPGWSGYILRLHYYQWQHHRGRLALSLLVIPILRNGALYPSGSSGTEQGLDLVTAPEQYCTPKRITKRTIFSKFFISIIAASEINIMSAILEDAMDNPEPDLHCAFPS